MGVIWRVTCVKYKAAQCERSDFEPSCRPTVGLYSCFSQCVIVAACRHILKLCCDGGVGKAKTATRAVE